VIKLFYDCRRDASALHYEYGVDIQGVVDLQLAKELVSPTPEHMRQRILRSFSGDAEVQSNPESYMWVVVGHQY